MKWTKGWLIDRLFNKRPKLRRALTKLREGDKDIAINILGTDLTVNTVKENGYLRASRLCERSSLLRDEIAIIIRLAFLLDSGDTFIDIGANVGIYCHTFARFASLFPQMRFYAFEANPDTCIRLRQSASPNLHVESVALAEKAGTLEFTGGAVSHVFTTSANTTEFNIQGQTQVIQTRRLDDFPIEGDSLVIKIDVEGQELSVLRGAAGLLAAKRIKAVYIDGYQDREVERILLESGFRLFDGRTMEPTNEYVFALLAIHPDKVRGLIDRDKNHVNNK